MLFKRTSCNISPHASKVSLGYRKKRIQGMDVVNTQQTSRQSGKTQKGVSHRQAPQFCWLKMHQWLALRAISLRHCKRGRLSLLKLGSRTNQPGENMFMNGRSSGTGDGHVAYQNRAGRFRATYQHIAADRCDVFEHVTQVTRNRDLLNRVLDHTIFDPIARRAA